MDRTYTQEIVNNGGPGIEAALLAALKGAVGNGNVKTWTTEAGNTVYEVSGQTEPGELGPGWIGVRDTMEFDGDGAFVRGRTRTVTNMRLTGVPRSGTVELGEILVALAALPDEP